LREVGFAYGIERIKDQEEAERIEGGGSED
jgi:hypothetical protein